MNKTGIPYLDYTWNPTKGCSHISKGCDQCWANKMSKRLAGNNVEYYDKDEPFKPTFCPNRLNEPLKLIKPSVIGVSFMGDLFHNDITDEQRMQIFEVMRVCPQHTFVLCTKRPENIVSFLNNYGVWFAKTSFPFNLLKHIWFGCSIENNRSLKERSESILIIHNHYKLNTWLSIEPLLEDISFPLSGIIQLNIADLFVVGGESGTGARYCNPMWIEKLWEVLPPELWYFKQWGTNHHNFDCANYNHYKVIEKNDFTPFKK